jgi:hypothetical protein
MKLVRFSLPAALAAGVFLTACPSTETTPKTEGTKAPVANGTPDAGAPLTTTTADDIQKAADEAAKKIDATNADSELDKLESEVGGGGK